MVNSFVRKKDLDSEMTVVRNEFELGENEPGAVLQERVLSTAFLWHNYGKSTIGARSDLGVIVHAILVNVLNPKLSIFFFAFLPQFVPTNEAAPIERMLLLSGVFMLVTLVVFIGYGLCAAAVRKHVISRPAVLKWMRRTFAAAFVALGARLALAER